MIDPLSPATEASSIAPHIDALFDAMLGLCTLVALGVFVAMAWFCVKYRRGSAADRSDRKRSSLPLELAWTIVPFLLFCGLFGWRLVLWRQLRTPPPDATAATIGSIRRQITQLCV